MPVITVTHSLKQGTDNQEDTLHGPLLLTSWLNLNPSSRVWISHENHMPSKQVRCGVKLLIKSQNTLAAPLKFMLGFRLNHVRKRDPWDHSRYWLS